jgi:FtsH-binding integral membrane protein
MLQLLVTVGFIALFVYNESAKLYAQQNPGLFIAALVLNIILIIALACCESVRRKAPTNFICLGLFTVCEGFLLGVAASTYKYD